jgi:hypothetical protein
MAQETGFERDPLDGPFMSALVITTGRPSEAADRLARLLGLTGTEKGSQ